jgi:transcriptional accessory protein Tex/SPT6
MKLEDVQIGMAIEGTVVNVTDYGAFVDIGLPDPALCHISRLTTSGTIDPHLVLKVGDRVMVHVDNIDTSRRRVSGAMIGRLQSTAEKPISDLSFSEVNQIQLDAPVSTSPLILLSFESESFSSEEIATACQYVAELYRLCGGDGLKVVGQKGLAFTAEEVSA